MMPFPPLTKSHIMIGGDSIHHVRIHLHLPSQFHALPDHHLHMVTPVRLIKMVVQRNNIPLHIIHKFLIHFI